MLQPSKLHGWYRVWASDRNVKILHDGWISWIEDLTAYEYWRLVAPQLDCTFDQLRFSAIKPAFIDRTKPWGM